MPPRPLRNFVNDASRPTVYTGLAKIKSDFLPSNQFLPDSNHLKQDSANAIKQHFASLRPVRFTNDDAKTYLATSAILHSFDGWNYLCNATNSLISGDGYISIHLAYYAELRAAMSLLASEGIGIFDHVHYCIDNTGIIHKSPDLTNKNRAGKIISNENGTHQFVWKALEEWSSNSLKTLTLLKNFCHNQKTFDQWLTFIPGLSPANTANIVKEWVNDWCFDIRHYKEDRIGRNTFSYRPTKLKKLNNSNLDKKLDLLSSFWKLFEPENSNRFGLLDKHLFKILFIKIHEQLRRNGSSQTISQCFDDMFIRAGISIDQNLKRLILAPNEHSLIALARNRVIDPDTKHGNPLSIIARALLSLRISSGSVADMLKTERVSKVDLDFYFDSMAKEAGFCESTLSPDFTCLWTQVNDSIIELEDWISSPPPDINLKALYEQNFENLVYFSQFNRIAFWGTGY